MIRVSGSQLEFVISVSCVGLSYFYGSLDLLNARRSYQSQMRCRIATNKSPVLDPKALSIFTIFRRLQQTLLDMLSSSSDTCSHLLLLVAVFVTLFRERLSYDICFIFYRPQALSFRFSLPKQRNLNLYFS